RVAAPALPFSGRTRVVCPRVHSAEFSERSAGVHADPPGERSGGVRLTAQFEAAGDRVDGAAEDLDTGKADDPEVVRLVPVEPGAVRDQDVLFSQQVQDEFLVAGDPEHLAVEAGEAVQRTLRGDTADARDGVEFIRGEG